MIYSGQNHEKNSGISSFKRKKLLPDQKGTWGGPFFWQGVAWYLAFTIKGKKNGRGCYYNLIHD